MKSFCYYFCGQPTLLSSWLTETLELCVITLLWRASMVWSAAFSHPTWQTGSEFYWSDQRKLGYLVLSQTVDLALQYGLPAHIDGHILDGPREHRVTARISVCTTHRHWYNKDRSDQAKSQQFFFTLRILGLTRPLLLTNLAVLADVFWWRICDPCMIN